MIHFSFLFLASLFMIFTDEALAQNGVIRITQPGDTGVQVGARTGSTLAQTLYNNAIVILFSISILALIIMLVWGSFDWIVSGGDKDKIKGAQKRITTAIIGVFVLAFAFFIAQVLGQIIGINILGPLQIPSLLGPGASSSAGGNVQ